MFPKNNKKLFKKCGLKTNPHKLDSEDKTLKYEFLIIKKAVIKTI